MKRVHSQWNIARLGKACRRLFRSDPKSGPTSLYQEMEMGAVIGFFASSLIALHLAGAHLSGLVMILASSLGLFLGAVIGTVLWISAAKLPEDAVLAPAPGQARSRKERRPGD
ncbi:MAG TPA: hypothetical protein VFF03_16190 [Rhodocyclaceae bacterium]|nr:hypothetical protein [Rhodocyclaceae bacterium]